MNITRMYSLFLWWQLSGKLYYRNGRK